MPVVTSVSQATRACESSSRMASSTASEIWSAILSGCPSVTDSEVNVCSVMVAASLAGRPPRALATPRLVAESGRHLVGHRLGHRRLGGEGHVAPAPVAGQERDRVGVVLEADALGGDVVGHDQVEVLGPQLLLGVGQQGVGLGCEADQDLAGALAPAELGEDVGGGL